MGKILTNNFSTYQAELFHDSFDAAANNNYYMFAARSLPFGNDADPPNPELSIQKSYYEIYDEMLFGKKVDADDVYRVIRNRAWVSGTVYDIYDPEDSDLHEKPFFTITKESAEYSVFKCLDNKNRTPSTDRPLKSETSPDDEYYSTNDGYVWKYMFSIPQNLYDDFATLNFFPVVPDANVAANSVAGSIESYIIERDGINYNSYANGHIREAAVAGNNLIMALESDTSDLSANTDFYKNNSIYIRSGRGAGQVRVVAEYIVTGSERRILVNEEFETLPDRTSVFEIGPRIHILGDGYEAAAIATVNTSANSIHSIEVVNRGYGYTFAEAQILANTGYIDAQSNSVILADTASIKAIVSPKGGHGSDPYDELYARGVVVSATFDGNENQTIPASNDFRKFGLLKNPLFSNTVLTVDSAIGFADGNKIQQGSATAEISAVNADGDNTIRLRNIHGQFVTGAEVITSNTSNSEIASTSVTAIDRDLNTFNQVQTFSVDITDQGPQGTSFRQDELVTQPVTGATGYVFSANTTIMTLANVKGHFSVSDDASNDVQEMFGQDSKAVAKVTGEVLGDLHDGSGEVLYVENMEPVSRNTDQKERVKIIFEF